MEFTSQKDLLEYLGKNPNDRNLVKRKMRKGEVRMEDGMYILVDKDSIIHELEEEIKRLKSLKEGEGKNTLCSENATRSADATLERKIKELESDLDFQISENERLEAKVKRYQDSIRNSYYYINDTLHKKVNRPDYKAIIKLEWTLPWEDNQ